MTWKAFKEGNFIASITFYLRILQVRLTEEDVKKRERNSGRRKRLSNNFQGLLLGDKDFLQGFLLKVRAIVSEWRQECRSNFPIHLYRLVTHRSCNIRISSVIQLYKENGWHDWVIS